MIEDMMVRGFTEETRNDYVRHVRAFAAFIRRPPDTATAEDLRRFQLHQRQSGMQPPSINNSVSALRFFFTATLDRPDLARRLTVVREPLRLPTVLSVEEVTLLLQSAPGAKYKAALGTAYGAGLRVSEVVALKIGDIDSERLLLRVEQGKGRKDRHAMLSPQLLELLRDWWVEGRRRGVLLPRGWLFPGRNPIEPLSTCQINRRPRRRRSRRDQDAGVDAHAAAQLRHPPVGTGHRHPRHPGAARSRQAGDHSALHPRRQHHDPECDQPARPARTRGREEAESRSLARRR
jgi:integrase/recombinase XerD